MECDPDWQFPLWLPRVDPFNFILRIALLND